MTMTILNAHFDNMNVRSNHIRSLLTLIWISVYDTARKYAHISMNPHLVSRSSIPFILTYILLFCRHNRYYYAALLLPAILSTDRLGSFIRIEQFFGTVMSAYVIDLLRSRCEMSTDIS